MLDRRAFLLSGLAIYGASARELFAAGPAVQNPKFPTSPFTLGVCSGDPTPDGVVLWTRLAIDPLNGGGMPKQPVEVQWQMATDDRLSRVVGTGRAMASPDWAHSVHVEVSGLEPHTWYWYQFRAGNELSPIGRTRTFPRAQSAVDRLRFAIASCQHFEAGLYTAYQHMAEEDLDLVLHLGDYIYEGAGIDKLVRKHVGGELMAIDDYRNRYAQYRSDPALRAVHAAVSVHRRLGRSRGRQQLRGAAPGGGRADRTVRASPRRRLQGVLRAHAASTRIDSERRVCCSSIARLPTERWRASRCWILANTGPISPAATTSSLAATRRGSARDACSARRRKSG